MLNALDDLMHFGHGRYNSVDSSHAIDEGFYLIEVEAAASTARTALTPSHTGRIRSKSGHSREALITREARVLVITGKLWGIDPIAHLGLIIPRLPIQDRVSMAGLGLMVRVHWIHNPFI